MGCTSYKPFWPFNFRYFALLLDHQNVYLVKTEWYTGIFLDVNLKCSVSWFLSRFLKTNKKNYPRNLILSYIKTLKSLIFWTVVIFLFFVKSNEIVYHLAKALMPNFKFQLTPTIFIPTFYDTSLVYHFQYKQNSCNSNNYA